MKKWQVEEITHGFKIEEAGAWFGDGTARSREETRNNAMLCAAAPDLLAALKESCDEVNRFDVPRCYASREANGHCQCTNFCKTWEAIQKARGK